MPDEVWAAWDTARSGAGHTVMAIATLASFKQFDSSLQGSLRIHAERVHSGKESWDELLTWFQATLDVRKEHAAAHRGKPRGSQGSGRRAAS